MSPVDRDHSRFGKHGTLGEASIWDCPACGKQNEGRKPEQGCVHCGSGDPGKSQAGQSPAAVAQSGEQREASAATGLQPGPTSTAGRRFNSGPPPVAAPLRVLRLIEYLIHPNQQSDDPAGLRRALVGTLEMGWGTITATIVDSLNERQDDLLGLAKRQPGVWVGGPGGMCNDWPPPQPRIPAPYMPPLNQTLDPVRTWERLQETRSMQQSDAPPPPFTGAQALTATTLIREWGLKFAHTLALALSNLATELEGNAEPEKFLTPGECLGLAHALMAQIPDDWEGDLPPTEQAADVD